MMRGLVPHVCAESPAEQDQGSLRRTHEGARTRTHAAHRRAITHTYTHRTDNRHSLHLALVSRIEVAQDPLFPEPRQGRLLARPATHTSASWPRKQHAQTRASARPPPPGVGCMRPIAWVVSNPLMPWCLRRAATPSPRATTRRHPRRGLPMWPPQWGKLPPLMALHRSNVEANALGQRIGAASTGSPRGLTRSPMRRQQGMRWAAANEADRDEGALHKLVRPPAPSANAGGMCAGHASGVAQMSTHIGAGP